MKDEEIITNQNEQLNLGTGELNQQYTAENQMNNQMQANQQQTFENQMNNQTNQNGNMQQLYEEVKPKFEEVAQKKVQLRTDSYFDGGLIELIGWKILAGIITVITFGIGAPWAHCMLYEYQFKHTIYNGKRLKFEGKGGDLFVNGFKWVLLTIITFGIYLFFVPARKTNWVISNLHFEDEDFITNDSYYEGSVLGFVGVNLLCKILNFISFGLLIPFTVCFKLKYIIKHSIINRKRIIFTGTGISLFLNYLLWVFLTIITFGIFGFWLRINMLKWQTKHTHIKQINETEEKDNSMLIAIPIAIFGVIIFFVALPTILGLLGSAVSGITGTEYDNPFEGSSSKIESVNKVNDNMYYNYGNH